MPYIFIPKDTSLHCASGIIWYTQGRRKCHVQKSRMSLCVIRRYDNISLVSLIKNAKILKFTFCEVKHNYYEWKVKVLATFVYAQFMGIQLHCCSWLHCVQVHGDIQSHHHSWLHCVQVHRDIQSHCHGWLHCVWVHGDIHSHHHGWLLAYARGSHGQGITRSFIKGQSRSTFLP